MADWGALGGAQRFDVAGSLTGTTAGTAITAPGGTNTKGAYTQLIASTSADAVGVMLTINTTGSTMLFGLLDIAIGGSGSEVVVIPDLPIFRFSGLNTGFVPIFIPVAIPAGSRISARYQNDAAGLSASVSLELVAGNINFVASPRVTAYGISTSVSRGTTVDPGGTAHTKGAYAELVAATAFKSNWAVVTTFPDTTPVGEAGWLLDIALGASGSEVPIISNMLLRGSASYGTGHCRFALPLALPEGVRVAARLQCTSTATGRTLQLAMHVSG